jgi:hypothetical protein
MDNQLKDVSAWTEIDYSPICYNTYIKVPLFEPKNVQFYRCRQGKEKELTKLIQVVFKAKGAEEWEDDPRYGNILAMTLGDGDEELTPVEIYNMGVDADELVKVVDETEDTITFHIRWPYGEIAISQAKVVNGDFEINKKFLDNEQTVDVVFTPHDEQLQEFSLPLTIPFTGLAIRNGEGELVKGDLEIPFGEIMGYTYEFKGNDKDDRFGISFNGDKKIYQYVLNDDFKLSIRNKRDRMAKIGEIDLKGSLAVLLQGIPNAVIKHKDDRWRITVCD